jgi:hypothetical protein
LLWNQNILSMSLSQYSIVLTCIVFLSKDHWIFLLYLINKIWDIDWKRTFFILLALHQVTVGLLCYQCTLYDTVNGNTGVSMVTDGVGYSCYVSTTLISFVFMTNESFRFSFQKIIAFASGTSVVNCGAIFNCNAGNVTPMIYCCIGDRCNTVISLSTSFGLVIVPVPISIVFRVLIIG